MTNSFQKELIVLCDIKVYQLFLANYFRVLIKVVQNDSNLDLTFGLIQFVLIVKTIWFKKTILVKFGARFSWKYVVNSSHIVKCYSVCVLDERMKCSHYIIATFCCEFCFVLHFCLTKGYLFFLGRKYRVFCEPEYFTIIAFLRIFRVSIYAKQIDLPRTRRYFDIFYQFNWIYRVFLRIGDTKIITRSEMNYGCLKTSTTK